MVFGRRPRLLIVDDDADLQSILKVLAELEGYEVLQALDGASAFSLACDAQPDVVLIDICMPLVDGRELLSTLKAHPGTAQIPVLMCSARHELADRAHSLELGAADYLDKPFDFRSLLSKITGVLERFRLNRESDVSQKPLAQSGC